MGVKTVTVKAHPNVTYNQISGLHCKFAWLNAKHEQLMFPVQCKDYLQDIIWAEHHKKEAAIYGLKYAPGQLDLKLPRFPLEIQLTGSPRMGAEHLNRLIDFLHAWEKKADISPTTWAHVEGHSDRRVLYLDPAWLTTSVHVSTYALLCRIGLYWDGETDPWRMLEGIIDTQAAYVEETAAFWKKNAGNYAAVPPKMPKHSIQPVDAGYVQQAAAKLKALWHDGKFPAAKPWTQIAGVSTAHHAGIVNGSKG